MSSDEEPEETTIATDLVVTKYKMGAEIVNGKCIFYVILDAVIAHNSYYRPIL